MCKHIELEADFQEVIFTYKSAAHMSETTSAVTLALSLRAPLVGDGVAVALTGSTNVSELVDVDVMGLPPFEVV